MAIEDNKCCMCISARAGSLIIGYVNLIFIICSIITYINIITNDNSMGRYSIFHPYKMNLTLLISAYIMLVLMSLALIFTILLLIGLHWNRQNLVKAYLIFHLVFLVTYLVAYFRQLASGNLTIAVNDLGIVFWLIIRSHYVKMGRDVKHASVNKDIERKSSGSVTMPI